MNTSILRSPCKRVWREFYKAALYELDLNKVSGRIVEAERALVTRSAELFYSAKDNIEEEHAVDDAMCALNALRSTLQSRSNPKNAFLDLAA